MANPITYMGFMMPRDGYGYATIKIGQALTQLEPERVSVIDMRLDGPGPDYTRFGRVGDRQWNTCDLTVAVCVPDWLKAINAPLGLIAHTMFEATRLPAGWVDTLNKYASAVVVPSSWCKEVFEDNGVAAPVHVVKWGIDPVDYYPLQRPLLGNRPYTFLWSGTPDLRKGYDLAYGCFWKAFQGSKDVKLIMHFRDKPKGLNGIGDENVEMIVGYFDRPELRSMLAQADCYVFPSRGEGWGSPPREAAATGIPVIATNHGGLAEDIDEWALPLRTAGSSPAEYGWWDAGTIGEWAEPDPDHLVELMRWCYAHQAEADAYGARASSWMQRHTWHATARGMMQVADAVYANVSPEVVLA